MAGLLEYHTRASVAITPVPANKAVALMNVSNALDRLNGHYLTDLAGIDDVLERDIESCETKNVADEDENTLRLCGSLYLAALLGGSGDRLFKEEIVSLLKYSLNRL